MPSQGTVPAPNRNKVDRELTGAALTIGERRVQPVAQLSGWTWESDMPGGRSAGAWLQLLPVEVRVQEEGGDEYRLPINDVTADRLRQMFLGALAFGLICWFLAWLMERQAGRKRRRR